MKQLHILLRFLVAGFLLILIGGSAMAANMSSVSDSAKPGNVLSKVEYNSPKKAILVKKDNPQFTITLESNPTTGFSWFLSKYNRNLLEVVSQKHVAPSSRLIGAPGHEVWTFRVKDVGFKVPQVLKIRMIYARPWEKKTGNSTTFRVFTIQ